MRGDSRTDKYVCAWTRWQPGGGWIRSGVLLLGLAVAWPALRAETTRTQTIALKKGWNAVYLQVSPANADPAAVFAGTPITTAASYFAIARPVQYIQDPAAIAWNQEGWAVWYSPDRPEAFLSSLHAIYGNRAYLILARQDFNWNVTGTVAFEPVKWKSDSFNLVGFGVDETAPPTFDQFFAASAAHHPYRVYRLSGSQWMQVANPVATRMRAGEACWIYCRGRSDYQGPLLVKLPAGQEVGFANTAETGLLVANQSKDPMTVQVETVATDGGVPLAYMLRGITPGRLDYVSFDLPPTYTLPSLEAGASASFWLKLRRERMTQPVQSCLLKVTTDDGVKLWVPVTGDRSDLAPAP